MKNLSASPQVANSFDASADTLDKVKKMGKQLREDFTAPSYNLDLLCFKYDKNKKLVGLISPYTLVPKNADKSQLAILHSGDDPDGVGVGFDEEILINVADVAPNVDCVFFVVSSEDYGFDKIKGGLCALIRTKDEKELLSNNLTEGGDHQTLIFASMRRTGSDWTLENISDFIEIDEDKTSPLDDTIDDILRNRYC
jgi:stress response protein SCP2